MSPLINNILVTVASLIYVFGVVAIMDFIVKKGFPQDLSRKVVHIAAGSWLVFWSLYNDSHWTKYLNIAPAFIWTILLLIKGFTAKEDDQAVKTMTRTGNRKELLKGPLYFTLVMSFVGTILFKANVSLVAMGFLTWGDGLAPVFGSRYGKHEFYFLSKKTIEGSIAFFIFGIIGTVLFYSVFGVKIDLLFILFCAVLATLIEAYSPKDMDNIFIPLGLILFYILYY